MISLTCCTQLFTKRQCQCKFLLRIHQHQSNNALWEWVGCCANKNVSNKRLTFASLTGSRRLFHAVGPTMKMPDGRTSWVGAVMYETTIFRSRTISYFVSKRAWLPCLDVLDRRVTYNNCNPLTYRPRYIIFSMSVLQPLSHFQTFPIETIVVVIIIA